MKKGESEILKKYEKYKLKSLKVLLNRSDVELWQKRKRESALIDLIGPKLKRFKILLNKKKEVEDSSRQENLLKLEGSSLYQIGTQALEIILNYLNDSDIFSFRLVNSTWSNAATNFIRNRFSQKKIVRLNVNHLSCSRFIKLFEKNPLHDSILLEFNENELEEPNEEIKPADVYESLVSAFGPLIKHLDLGKTSINLQVEEFEKRNVYDEVESLIEPNFFEKMIFEDFPNLVSLTIEDFVYTPEQHMLIFCTKVERRLRYQKQELTSLKIFNFTVFFGNHEGKKVLSHEILKISPNLSTVAATIMEIRSENTRQLMQNVLMSISKFALNVRDLSFISHNDVHNVVIFEFEIFPSLITEDYFKNLNLQQFNIAEFRFRQEDLERRLEFLREFTPIGKTVEKFGLVSHLNYFDDEVEHENILFPILEGFSNLKIVEIKLPFDTELTNHLFNQFQNESPAIEELTISRIPSNSQVLQPWTKLKRLKFNDASIGMDFQEHTAQYFTGFQNFAPNLTHLEIQITGGNKKSIMISYPFFVWFGSKWRELAKFKLTVHELSWVKGAEELSLGIPSIDVLSDSEGNFTSEEIKKLDVSRVMESRLFHSFEENFTGGQYVFFTWLVEKFPKHELFSLFNQRHGMKLRKESYPVTGSKTLLLLIYRLALQERGLGLRLKNGANEMSDYPELYKLGSKRNYLTI